MMQQYFALKAQAGDCLLFYRMGDFFELFFEDARQAAGVLDIALTSRGEHDGQPVPMCGVPVHAAENYLARLIKAGCRVAIAEQVETPEEAKKRGGSKALVARDIVRFVTAGTLTEDALPEPRRANMLAAICELRGTVGLASCDISTGRMELEECAPERMGAALARLGASEVVAPDGWEAAPDGATMRPRASFASDEGDALLRQIHHVATLDGFGSFTRPMLAAAAGLVAYLDHAGRGTLPFLLPPVLRETTAHLAMDEATRSSLEILTSQQGGRQGSLVAAVDRCVTGAGARLLAFFDIAPGYKSIKHHLRAASEQQAVDYELLQALIATESGFDAQAVSPKGAVGLMQLMPATASRFGVRADAKRSLEQKLADPAVNVPAGTRYLRYLLDLFPGRMDLALAAYNAGEGAVQRAGNQIPAFKETQNYVRTVLALYHQLKPPAPVQAHRAAPGRVRMQLQGGAHNRGNLPPDTVVAHSRASNEPLPTIPNE